MLVGVAPLPPSLIPAHWNIGILHYKQAKLRKDMQHSVIHKTNMTHTHTYSLFVFIQVIIHIMLLIIECFPCMYLSNTCRFIIIMPFIKVLRSKSSLDIFIVIDH